MDGYISLCLLSTLWACLYDGEKEPDEVGVTLPLSLVSLLTVKGSAVLNPRNWEQ